MNNYINFKGIEQYRTLYSHIARIYNLAAYTNGVIEEMADQYAERHNFVIHSDDPPGITSSAFLNPYVDEYQEYTFESYFTDFLKIPVPALMPNPEIAIDKNRPSFFLGFEIEGCVNNEVIGELQAYLRSIYPKGSWHRDGSVRATASFTPFEFSTPPLSKNIAIERIEWCLGTLSVLSEEGLFITNNSCGFHVNISEKKTFSNLTPIRNKFALEFMKRFDVTKWKKRSIWALYRKLICGVDSIKWSI